MAYVNIAFEIWLIISTLLKVYLIYDFVQCWDFNVLKSNAHSINLKKFLKILACGKAYVIHFKFKVIVGT